MRHAHSLLIAAVMGLMAWGPAARGSDEQARSLMQQSFAARPAEELTTLNLGNPLEAARVRWSLQGNGIALETLPMLNRGLEGTQAAPLVGGDTPGMFASALVRQGVDLAPLADIVDFAVGADGKVQATAVSSFPNGRLPVSIVSLTIFDAEMNRLGGAANPDWGNGTYNSVTTPRIDLPGNKIADGAAIAQAVFVMGASDGTVVVQERFQSLSIGYPQTIRNEKPVARPGTNRINICLDRGLAGNSDCTYGPNPDFHRQVVIPIKGQATFLAPIRMTATKRPMVTATAELLPASGGSCRLTLNVGKNIQLGPDGKQLLWDIPEANFGQTCFQPGEMMSFRMEVSATTTNGASVIRIGNLATYQPSPSTVKIAPMQVQYGCVAAGTPVAVIGHAEPKPIEEVALGDHVLSRPGGPILAVRDIVHGEDDGIRAIHTENHTGNKHVVAVTPTHPMPTAGGIIAASAVQVGTSLITIDGPSTVTAIHTVPRGKVFNLQLGAGDDGVLPAPDTTTFIAGGVVVGDLTMQKVLELSARRAPDAVREVMKNSAFSTDYENYTRHSR